MRSFHMRRPRMLVCAFALLLAGPGEAAAQRVAGTWQVTYDSDIARNGDVATVKRRGTGRLVLEQRGDSVFGHFTAEGAPGPGRPLRGTFDGRALTLTTGLVRRTVTVNGTPTEMPTRTDWMGVLEGDALRGTMFIAMGKREPTARRWEAIRGKEPR